MCIGRSAWRNVRIATSTATSATKRSMRVVSCGRSRQNSPTWRRACLSAPPPPSSLVAAILDAVAQHWAIAPDIEITVEANPTSVEAGRFRGYRTAGVNRVSLGVQALDDLALQALGRRHTAGEARQAIAIARRVFDRFSFDLIYARPEQMPADWCDELKEA